MEWDDLNNGLFILYPSGVGVDLPYDGSTTAFLNFEHEIVFKQEKWWEFWRVQVNVHFLAQEQFPSPISKNLAVKTLAFRGLIVQQLY